MLRRGVVLILWLQFYNPVGRKMMTLILPNGELIDGPTGNRRKLAANLLVLIQRISCIQARLLPPHENNSN